MNLDKTPETATTPVRDGTWHVVCLCAAWCGVCRQYEADFLALHSKFPSVHFSWLDVEDEEDLMGDLDIETFPTLLIGCGSQAMFLGPLLPQVKVLERLLESLMQGQAPSSSVPPEAAGLWQRIAAKWS